MTVLDENRIPAIIAVSNTDGSTVLPVYGNSANNSLSVDDDITGTDQGGGDPDRRDVNRKVAFMAVSSVDGVTPVEVYVDATTNKLLINSN